MTEVRKNGTLTYLRPDGKTQVTVEYDENNKPVRVDTIVISTQHDAEVTLEQIQADIKEHVINAVVPAELLDAKQNISLTQLAVSLLADLKGMLVLQDVKLSLIRTAVMLVMAAVHSLVKIQRK